MNNNYFIKAYFIIVLSSLFSIPYTLYGKNDDVHFLTIMTSGGNVNYKMDNSNTWNGVNEYAKKVVKDGEGVKLWFPLSTLDLLSSVTINGKNIISNIEGNFKECIN